MSTKLKTTNRYLVKVVVTKEVEVWVPDDLTTEQAISDWCRGLWHIDGVDEIATYGATVAAIYGDGSHDGVGRIGTEIAAKYAPADRPIQMLYDIRDEDVETEILESPQEAKR